MSLLILFYGFGVIMLLTFEVQVRPFRVLFFRGIGLSGIGFGSTEFGSSKSVLSPVNSQEAVGEGAFDG